MKKILSLILFVSCLLGPGLFLSAQDQRESLFYVFYEVGRSDWSLSPDIRFFADSISRAGIEVDSVVVKAFTSPSGTYSSNQTLSENRANTVADSLVTVFSNTVILSSGENTDWEGLRKLLSFHGGKQESDIIHIIDTVPLWVRDSSGKVVDSRKRQLMTLNGGKAWKYLLDKYFLFIRRTDISVYWKEPAMSPAVDSIAVPVSDSTKVEVVHGWDIIYDPVILNNDEQVNEDVIFRKEYRNGLVLYTNLLYCGALVPNIGTQISLGKGWALDARWGYAWWSSDAPHFYWRIYGGELAVRKYFGRKGYPKAGFKSLIGHHLGIYGQVFTYDFELGGHGYMGGDPTMNISKNPSYGGGIEYGYTVRLGENFNLDFSIGAGYLGGIYHEYDPFGSHYIWRSTSQRNWFGPTRADITLQWLIGTARNQKKEGSR